MPLRRRRRRWDSGMPCCMPLRRACIDSLPRFCMPHYPIHPHIAHPPHESSSSQSDCSCFEEKFCTVENCRNAPMCLSTRPRFCPYGISYQSSGKIHRPSSEVRKYCRRMAETNHPRGSFCGREAAPNLTYPKAASSLLSSPEYEKTTERRFSNVRRYRGGIASDLPVQNISPSDIQRITQTRMSDAMPEFVSRSPRLQSGADFAPQVPISHTPNITNSQVHAEDRFEPPVHIPLTESVTGEREIITQHRPMYFDKSTDTFDREENGKLQESGYRKLQCTQHSTGHCDMEWECSKNYPPHHNATFDGSYGNFLPPFEPKATSSRLDDFSQQGELKTSGVTPDIRGLDASTGKSNQTHLDCSQTRGSPVEKPPNHYSTLTRNGAFNESKCSCRYPPSFKHLSCSGNIAGSCSCDD